MTHDIFRPRNSGNQIEAKIYFGRNCPELDNGVIPYVHDCDFDDFLLRSVVPHFPGFNVITCDGHWNGENEICSIVSILLDDTANNRTQVRWIAEHYKSKFKQEAVAISFHACEFVIDVWPHGPNVADYRQSPKTGDAPSPDWNKDADKYAKDPAV
jgi:hypothetical protein